MLNKDDLVKLKTNQHCDTSKLKAYNIPQFITAVNKLEKAYKLTDYQEYISNFKAILDEFYRDLPKDQTLYRCEQSIEELKQKASAISEADIAIELSDTIQKIKTTKNEEYIEGDKLLSYTLSEIEKIKSEANDECDKIQTQFNEINQKVTDLLECKNKLESALENIQTQYKRQLITQINENKTFKIKPEDCNITFNEDGKSATVEVQNVFFEKQIVTNLSALSGSPISSGKFFSKTITATIELDNLNSLQTSSVAINKSASPLQKEVKGGGNIIVPQGLLNSQDDNLQGRMPLNTAIQPLTQSSTKATVISSDNLPAR